MVSKRSAESGIFYYSIPGIRRLGGHEIEPYSRHDFLSDVQ
jgi:hypothetical protein